MGIDIKYSKCGKIVDSECVEKDCYGDIIIQLDECDCFKKEIEDAKEKGYKRGYDRGYDEGCNKAYDKGFEDGMDACE